MEETVSLKDIFKILQKSWKLIFTFVFVAVLISGILSFYVITPVYQASTQILVNQKDSQDQLDFSRISSNIELINTYSVIIKSRAILDKVIEELEIEHSVEALYQNISINRDQNSQVFSVIVRDSNPGRAVDIANAVSKTFQKEIKGIMNVNNVSILTEAVLKDHPSPVKPVPLINIAIAIVVGFIMGVGVSFLIAFLDNTLKDAKDVEAYIGLPVLGDVQKMTNKKEKKRLSHSTVNKIGVEALEPKINK
ncbi:capsular biosynthesis protein [Bacillus sp. Bva_UNVM-123]|uniref:YveK family protein n=1 Tax=Bacillus sp. Bva_UNVM-123 TaxID=2829798 RepID=UPI00391F315C